MVTLQIQLCSSVAKKDDVSVQEKKEVCVSDSFCALQTQSVVSFSVKS